MRVFSWDEAMANGGAELQAFLRSWAESAAPGKGECAFAALTVGDFDGCHLGHAALFRNVVAASKKSLKRSASDVASSAGEKRALVPGAVTFRRGASSPEKKGRPAPYVSTLRQRLAAMEMAGLAFVLVIDFSCNFSKMSGSDFLEALATNARMRYLSVGEDFRCGYKLGTGQKEIAQAAGSLGFAFEPLSQVLLAGRRVSSTDIREAVLRADFAAAQRLLGHPFALDISALGFQALEEKSCERPLSAFYAPLKAFAQVLPPAGRSSALLCGEGLEGAECVCSIDWQSLFVECKKELFLRCGKIAADKKASAFFDEIRFIKELSF